MGEARRKRNLTSLAPCICGSPRIAGRCCYDGKQFRRKPSDLDLYNTEESGICPNCYLSATGACSDKTSREHLVSRAVLTLLKKQQLVVSGMPWQPINTSTAMGFNTLTSRCLCTAHNNALSPLDEAATQLFRFIECAYSNKSQPGFRGLVSGHDVERWLLKTLMAFMTSKSLMKNGLPLDAPLHPAIDVVTLLNHPLKWPSASGLYIAGKVGDRLQQTSRFGLAPLTVEKTGELVGMNVEILGMIVTFIATSPSLFTNIPLSASHRPGKIALQIGEIRNEIKFSWEDSRNHGDFVLTHFPGGWPDHPPNHHP